MASTKPIFRYKFSDDFVAELYKFSKIHQYDDRRSYKDAWSIWLEENSEIVEAECQRLGELDYTGNVLEKMFKSGRYYFRKKSTNKKEPAARRSYVSVDKSLLDTMDRHIASKMREFADGLKPSNAFIDYIGIYNDIHNDFVSDLHKQGIMDPVEIQDKIKKTYKNRYFTLFQKNT